METTEKAIVCIREANENDVSFIFATMLIGLYYGGTFWKEVQKNVFMDNYHKVIANLLSSPKTVVKIACLKDDISVILSYAILSRDEKVLHFVYTKVAFRKYGIAKDLVPGTVKEATHFTKLGLSIMKSKGITYNPFNM